MDFSVFRFRFKMEHVFRLADTHMETQNVFKRSGRPYEKKMIQFYYFFLCVKLNSILRGYIQNLFLLCHAYSMDKQYLIMMVCMFSFLVIINLCIPMMINPLECFYRPQQCWGHLALSCQSKYFHLGTSI